MSEAEDKVAIHELVTHRAHDEAHAAYEHGHTEHLARIAALEAALAEHEQRVLEHMATYHAPEPVEEAVEEVEEEPERLSEVVEEAPEREPPKAEVPPRASHPLLRRYGRGED